MTYPLDFHKQVAAKYFGVEYDKVTPEQRMASKRNLWAWLYSGAGPTSIGKVVK